MAIDHGVTESGTFGQADRGQWHANAADNSGGIFDQAGSARWDRIENRISGLLSDAHQFPGGLDGMEVKGADPCRHQN
jgi:hypothetical protein